MDCVDQYHILFLQVHLSHDVAFINATIHLYLRTGHKNLPRIIYFKNESDG